MTQKWPQSSLTGACFIAVELSFLSRLLKQTRFLVIYTPNTIAGFVVAVIAETMQRHPYRTRTEISEKVFETSLTGLTGIAEPTFANFNPSTTIAMEVVGSGIQASFHHAVVR